MAYVTIEALTARVGGKEILDQLTDDDGGGGEEPDSEVLVAHMAQVDALLDGYARRGGYTTPLSTADADSVMLPLLDIANYKLRSRGNRVASEDDRLQYQNAMALLGLIGDGKWIFPSGPTVDASASLQSECQLFSRTLLRPL